MASSTPQAIAMSARLAPTKIAHVLRLVGFSYLDSAAGPSSRAIRRFPRVSTCASAMDLLIASHRLFQRPLYGDIARPHPPSLRNGIMASASRLRDNLSHHQGRPDDLDYRHQTSRSPHGVRLANLALRIFLTAQQRRPRLSSDSVVDTTTLTQSACSLSPA